MDQYDQIILGYEINNSFLSDCLYFQIMNAPHSQQLTQFIGLVPKNLRKYIRDGIFMVPASSLIPDYQHLKTNYLDQIAKTKQPSANSMHKYTSVMPISEASISSINDKCAKPLSQYYSRFLKQYNYPTTEPNYHGGFAITYNQGHKGLGLHKDDSIYTVNICLLNKAQGNQVVFLNSINIEMIEDFACIHAGPVPHHTQDLKSGERVNVVMWFK